MDSWKKKKKKKSLSRTRQLGKKKAVVKNEALEMAAEENTVLQRQPWRRQCHRNVVLKQGTLQKAGM